MAKRARPIRKPKTDNYSNMPQELPGHGGDMMDPTRVAGPGDPMTRLFSNSEEP